MADRMPNYELEIKRLQVDMKQLEVNVEKMELRELELQDESRRLAISREDTLKRIEEDKRRIAEFNKNRKETSPEK